MTRTKSRTSVRGGGGVMTVKRGRGAAGWCDATTTTRRRPECRKQATVHGETGEAFGTSSEGRGGRLARSGARAGRAESDGRPSCGAGGGGERAPWGGAGPAGGYTRHPRSRRAVLASDKPQHIGRNRGAGPSDAIGRRGVAQAGLGMDRISVPCWRVR